MKIKRHNKTKDELMDETARKAEIARKRKIITDDFYPALVDATVSVDEAKALIQAMGSLLMAEVLKTMKERKFSEISPELLKGLCPDGERKEEIIKLLSTLSDENLFVSREIIEGMTNAVENMIMIEMRDRKLDTLKADWDKFLN